MVCVGTKRGVNYGLVYNAEGVVIGRVFRHKRAARAALGGGRQPFWTACAILDGMEASASLGTRHVSRHSAVGAIRDFWTEHDAVSLRGIYPSTTRATFNSAVARFKMQRPRSCALVGRAR